MKNKVLLISSGGLMKSGVPSVLMTIVRALSDKYTFDILVHTDEEGFFDKEFLSYGGLIFRLPKKHSSIKLFDRLLEITRPLYLQRHTRKLIKENGPYTIIHCNNDFDSAGCVSAAAKEGIPVRICHTHRTWENDSKTGLLTKTYRKICRKAIIKASTSLIGCSASANSSTFGKDAKAEILFNSYDEKHFSPTLPLVQPKNISLIQVGYFNSNKNQLFSVNILKELKKATPDAHLTLIGDRKGSYGESVEKAISDFGLNDSVKLLPPNADIPKEMEKSNILLFPSNNEGFGIVLIEAQAMGLHCLSSDTVPRETDMGGVVYMSLADGAETWASYILSDSSLIEKRIQDCSKYTTEKFIESVKALYSL